MVQEIYLLFCAHPESDSYWIEAASRSKPYIEELEKKMWDHYGGDGCFTCRIVGPIQLRGEILR